MIKAMSAVASHTMNTFPRMAKPLFIQQQRETVSWRRICQQNASQIFICKITYVHRAKLSCPSYPYFILTQLLPFPLQQYLRTPLYCAAESNCRQTASALLENHADVNVNGPVSASVENYIPISYQYNLYYNFDECLILILIFYVCICI